MIHITEPSKLVTLTSPFAPAIAHGIVVCGIRKGSTGDRVVFWFHTGKQVEACVMESRSDMPAIALLTGVESIQLTALVEAIDTLLPLLKTQGNAYFLDTDFLSPDVQGLIAAMITPILYHRVIGPYTGSTDKQPLYVIDLFTHGRNNTLIELGKILTPKKVDMETKAKEVYAHLMSIGQTEKAEKLLNYVSRINQ